MVLLPKHLQLGFLLSSQDVEKHFDTATWNCHSDASTETREERRARIIAKLRRIQFAISRSRLGHVIGGLQP